MSGPRPARIVVGALLALLVVFLVADLFVRGSVSSPNGGWDVFYLIAFLLAAPTFAVAGTMIVVRQPQNTIGWLLVAIPLLTSFAFLVGDYATYGLVSHPGAVPFSRATAWLDRWLIVPTLSLMIPLFLLFPDGRVPSRRWRPVLWLAIAAPAVATLAFAVTPGRMTGAFAQLERVRVVNPFGIEALSGAIGLVGLVAGFATAVAAFLAGAALVARFRARRGEERQQVKWLAFVGVAFLIELVLTIVVSSALGESNAGNVAGNLGFAVMFATLAFGVPIACAVAVLRYRLYDLDIVVRKTIAVGGLALFVTVVYAIIVAGVGTRVGGGAAASFAAAAVLAVLFQPARDRARRLADRLVYGKRATPYEVLSAFSDESAEARSYREVLPHMVRMLAQGTGASRAQVWLRVGDDVVPAASFPESNGSSATSPGSTVDRSELRGAFPVVHQGSPIGTVTVEMTPSDPLTPPKQKLIEDFAAQAAHVLRNVQLVEELRASRVRLVAAQDHERRALERNIHDGAQQQLVALAVKTKLAMTVAERDDAVRTAAALDDVRAGAQLALEELRDVARGIYPPLLADQGLGVALEAQARKSTLATTVDLDGVGRHPQQVEAAVYFCTLEALQNAAVHGFASHAAVRLQEDGGEIRFEVQDDGRGFDPAATSGSGLQAMADRLDALGGSLTVRSAPGTGTSVVGCVPVNVQGSTA